MILSLLQSLITTTCTCARVCSVVYVSGSGPPKGTKGILQCIWPSGGTVSVCFDMGNWTGGHSTESNAACVTDPPCSSKGSWDLPCSDITLEHGGQPSGCHPPPPPPPYTPGHGEM
eukprot:COSAG06_NODE_194_length_20530_cov_9.861583_4_plen_116_part_00